MDALNGLVGKSAGMGADEGAHVGAEQQAGLDPCRLLQPSEPWGMLVAVCTCLVRMHMSCLYAHNNNNNLQVCQPMLGTY